MKHIIPFLLLALTIAEPSSAYSRKRVPEPTPTPVVAVTPSPSPVDSEKPHFSFKCASTCTSAEVKRIAETQTLIEKFINSTCFDEAWLSFKRLEQSNGLKNQGIIDKIRNSQVKDIPIVFYWPTLFQSKSVIGYTYPDSPEIYLNRSFRTSSSWTVWSEASNLFHESLHKIGFDHDYNATERRPYSIPYRGNRAVEMCEGKI